MSSWLTPTRLILSAVLLGVCGLLFAGSRSLRMQQSQSGNIGALVMLLLVVWLPTTAREIVVSLCLVVILGLATGLIGALITAGVCTVLAMSTPAGTTVATTVLTVLCVVAVAADEFQMSRRIRAAKKLVPGQDSPHDVLISGVVQGPVVATLNLATILPSAQQRGDVPLTAWRATRKGTAFHSPMFTVDTSEGRVRVSLQHARLEMQKRVQISTSEPEQTAALLKALALNGHNDKDPLTVGWLEPNETVSVVGRPQWEVSADAVESYRETPLLPHFVGTKETPILVTNQAPEQARRNAIWDGVTYLVWSAVCGAIAWLQIAKAI